MEQTRYKMDNGSDNLYTLSALKDVFDWCKYNGVIDHENFKDWFNDGIDSGFLTECSR